MMEEKKGSVDFLRSAVGCFKDLPRGHIINLAQHMQQVVTCLASESLAQTSYLCTFKCIYKNS